MNVEEISQLIRPLAEVEREHIELAMNLADNNKALAAKKLGISLKTLYSKLNAYQAMDELPNVAAGWLRGES